MKRLLGIFLFFAAFTALVSCGKNNQNGPIPYVNVNRQLNLGNPQYSALNAVSGYVVLPDAGSRGIFVIRATTDDVAAFDMHCPYNLNDTCGVARPENGGFFMICSCCNSKWLMLNGSVYEGPAVYPLKSYTTSFSYPVVTITN